MQYQPETWPLHSKLPLVSIIKSYLIYSYSNAELKRTIHPTFGIINQITNMIISYMNNIQFTESSSVVLLKNLIMPQTITLVHLT